MVMAPPAELCLPAPRGAEGRESAWEERSPSEHWAGLGAARLPGPGPEVPGSFRNSEAVERALG